MTTSGTNRPEPGILLKLARLNWILILGVSSLVLLGVIALYSVAGGSFQPWATSQIRKLVFGFLIMLCVALVPSNHWKWLSIPIFVLSVGMLVLVEFLGVQGMGARRWLQFGSFRFQPSEVVKFSLILILASYYDRLDPRQVSNPLWLAAPVALIGIPTGMIILQPDLGSAMLLCASGLTLMFLAGVSIYYFFILGAIGIGVVASVLISRGTDWQLLKDYQYQRIDSFLNPELDPLGAGYHIIQAKIALGSGGLYGRGFLNGTQSQLSFLPEQHTDFIFTMLAEEFGLTWSLLAILFYVIILLVCIYIAMNSRDRFQSLMVMGLTAVFFLYFALNIAMITGMAPVVGVPLPLMSYGGTAAMTQLMAFGLILGVSINNS